MLYPSFWLLRLLFRLTTCRPNGFGLSHRYWHRAIVDPSIRSQDTGRRNRASEISSRFLRHVRSHRLRTIGGNGKLFGRSRKKLCAETLGGGGGRRGHVSRARGWAVGHETGDNRIVAIRISGFKRTATQEHDGCDHTSTNAPDPIQTPQLSVLGQE